MRWPWTPPRVVNPPSPSVWPKKVYFLDGPMAGKTGDAGPGHCVTVSYITHPKMGALWWTPENTWPATHLNTIASWTYEWETVYPRSLVAYVRFAA